MSRHSSMGMAWRQRHGRHSGHGRWHGRRVRRLWMERRVERRLGGGCSIDSGDEARRRSRSARIVKLWEVADGEGKIEKKVNDGIGGAGGDAVMRGSHGRWHDTGGPLAHGSEVVTNTMVDRAIVQPRWVGPSRTQGWWRRGSPEMGSGRLWGFRRWDVTCDGGRPKMMETGGGFPRRRVASWISSKLESIVRRRRGRWGSQVSFRKQRRREEGKKKKRGFESQEERAVGKEGRGRERIRERRNSREEKKRGGRSHREGEEVEEVTEKEKR